ncbi:MAG: 50S ribosomal protein L37ae [Candidatus Altiarchaeales archaeon HGW-Altiarchaeales-2]|nr:MAG: 50S ribosomal protein L37ae [Candidatus Altiarchaeales archaeon HGW-Altiarchaeales-2]
MVYSHTKKAGRCGRFGARIGKRTREDVNAIEVASKQMHECPKCGKKKVVRLEAGIWKCGGCKVKFAGGAYTSQVIKKI